MTASIPARLAAALALAVALLHGASARAEAVTESVTAGPTGPVGAAPAPAALRPIAVIISFGIATPQTAELVVRVHRHVELGAGLASDSMDRPLLMLRGLYPISTGRSWTLALHAGIGGGLDDGDDEAAMRERAYLRTEAGVTVERRGFTVRVSGGVDGVDQAPFAALGVGVAF